MEVQDSNPQCRVGNIRRHAAEAPGSLAHSCLPQTLGHCFGLGTQRAGPGNTGRRVGPPRPPAEARSPLSGRTETLDLAEALTQNRIDPKSYAHEGTNGGQASQGKTIRGPTETPKIFYSAFGVSQESISIFP